MSHSKKCPPLRLEDGLTSFDRAVWSECAVSLSSFCATEGEQNHFPLPDEGIVFEDDSPASSIFPRKLRDLLTRKVANISDQG